MIKRLLLIVVILCAGCIGGEESGPVEYRSDVHIERDAGVFISNFYAEKTELRSGGGTNLILEIENVGAAKAENLNIQLVNTGEFTVSEPVYQTSLSPPEPGAGIPGDKDKVIWQINAPSVELPVKKNIKTRIGFDYQTEMIKEIPVVNADKERAGGIQAGIESISAAPVNVYILSEDPIILSEGKTTGTAEFKLIIKNTGTGTVRSNESSPGGWCQGESLDCINSLKLEIVSQDPEFHEYLQIGCEGVDGSLSFSKNVEIENIRLWKGNNAIINCRINIDLQDADERYLVLKSIVSYRYHYEDEIQFSIS